MATVQEQLKDLEGRYAQRQAALATLFEEAGPELDFEKIKSISGDSTAKVEHIRALNKELDDLGSQIAEKREMLEIAGRLSRGNSEGQSSERTVDEKSFGELFVDSPAFKSKGAGAHLDIDVKTLMETGAGWEPESTRSGLVVPYATRPIQVSQLIPTVPINQSAYKYMEETTFTPGAAEKAEGAEYGEATFVLTERSKVVEKVTAWLPITDEQLEDVPGVRAYVEQRLRFALQQRFDTAIITGTGVSPALQGLEKLVGIGTQAKGSDSDPAAVYKAIMKCRVTGRAVPNVVIFDSMHWQNIRLLTTDDGVYIFGSPTEPGPERIWGLPVVLCDALVDSDAIVGDFPGFSLCGLRRGIDVQITNAHSDYFIKGKQAIRADFRCVLVWTRPAAFCLVTGLS